MPLPAQATSVQQLALLDQLHLVHLVCPATVDLTGRAILFRRTEQHHRICPCGHAGHEPGQLGIERDRLTEARVDHAAARQTGQQQRRQEPSTQKPLMKKPGSNVPPSSGGCFKNTAMPAGLPYGAEP